MMNSKNQKAEDGKNAGSAKKSVQTAVLRILSSERFASLLMRRASLGSVQRICVMCSGIRELQTL